MDSLDKISKFPIRERGQGRVTPKIHWADICTLWAPSRYYRYYRILQD